MRRPSACSAAPASDLLAGGHTHLQWTRYVDGALYVNPGSVGLAYDRYDDEPQPTAVAEYAVVTGGSGEVWRGSWAKASLPRAGLNPPAPPGSRAPRGRKA